MVDVVSGCAVKPERTPWRRAMADFRADAARYVYYDDPAARPTIPRIVRALAANQGLQALALYRLARVVYGGGRAHGFSAAVLMPIGRMCYPAMSRINDIVNGIWISRAADIGPGLYIAHYGGIVIGPARIGSNCNIGNSVTIGKSGIGDQAGLPDIGDRVAIAPGACVLGRLRVGDDAMIGANSVVTRDVASRAVVRGVPARQISDKGSFEYVSYPGMQCDPTRVLN